MQLLLMASISTAPPLLDVFLINDELDMMRYRLALHAPLAARTIIAESRWTHSGQPKPLHAAASLTARELRTYNIRLLDVPYTRPEQLGSNGVLAVAKRSVNAALAVEIEHRRYINQIILEEMHALLQTSEVRARGDDSDLIVHFSDVDELLDLDALSRAVRAFGLEALFARGGCRTPSLRGFYYGEQCPIVSTENFYPWRRSVLFRARSGFLEYILTMPRNVTYYVKQLRNLGSLRHHATNVRMCPPTAGWAGWHFGYFFNSETIASKLRSFHHQLEFSHVLGLAQSVLRDHLDECARDCLDVRRSPATAPHTHTGLAQCCLQHSPHTCTLLMHVFALRVRPV